VTPRAGEFDEPSGLLREETAWAFLQQLQPSDDQIREAIVAGVKLAHKLGVTAIHDIAKPAHIRAYMALHQAHQLKLRVRLNIEVHYLDQLIALGLRTGFGDELLKLGAIKFFADGSLGARNAALREPYQTPSGLFAFAGQWPAKMNGPGEAWGKLNYEQSELNRLVKRAHDHGFQVMIHAIGDRAIDAALEALSHAGLPPNAVIASSTRSSCTQNRSPVCESWASSLPCSPIFSNGAAPADSMKLVLAQSATPRLTPIARS
jgi:predicted amidohydrolase YtcJ